MNSQQNQGGKEQGFTLVEIMVVVAIIGLLATVVMQSVLPDRDYADLQKTKIDIAGIEEAIERYQLFKRKLPESLKDLTTEDETGRRFLKRLSKDPWLNDYEYTHSGGGNYVISSHGRNGLPGDGDDITSVNMIELQELPRIDTRD